MAGGNGRAFNGLLLAQRIAHNVVFHVELVTDTFAASAAGRNQAAEVVVGVTVAVGAANGG